MTDTDNWPRAPLPWQQEAWQRLARRVAGGTLPHATLLAGPAGIGKAHLHRALAGLLLCEAPADDMACGQCRNCSLLRAGSNPDLLRVELQEDSRLIKIDQVRGLIDYATKTPTLAPRKVILLGPAEAMNVAAANALLKCLEEPSASTVLLLYSHQVSLLPATVRSRCQIQALPVPGREAALAWLQDAIGAGGAAADLLDLCDGRPLAARQLHLADGQAAAAALQQGLDALLEERLSALEFPAVVADLDLEAALALVQGRLQKILRRQALSGDLGAGRAAFELHDELARLRRSVINGANPNRQLLLEDCAGALVRAVGHWRASTHG